MRKIKYAVLCVAWAFCAVACLAVGDKSVFKLGTGETVIGVPIEWKSDTVEVQTAYANIEIPYDLIDSQEAYVEAQEKTPEELKEEMEKKLAEARKKWRPMFSPENELFPDNELYRKFAAWQDDYRAFVRDNFPEGWKARLAFGFNIDRTTTYKKTYALRGELSRDWGSFDVDFGGYYNYVWEEYQSGTSKATTDKYGATATATWRYLGEDSDYFVMDKFMYRHDSIKRIKLQFDESILAGYAINIPNYGFKWAISVGPGIRYLEARHYDRHYITLGVLNEVLRWDITELLRFEHTGYFCLDLEQTNECSAYFTIGFVFAPKGIVNIALRFTNDYDSVTSSDAQTNEQRLMLSLELPLVGNGAN